MTSSEGSSSIGDIERLVRLIPEPPHPMEGIELMPDGNFPDLEFPLEQWFELRQNLQGTVQMVPSYVPGRFTAPIEWKHFPFTRIWIPEAPGNRIHPHCWHELNYLVFPESLVKGMDFSEFCMKAIAVGVHRYAEGKKMSELDAKKWYRENMNPNMSLEERVNQAMQHLEGQL